MTASESYGSAILPGGQRPGRMRLARHLAGSGVEVGPGHVPFELPFPGAEVRYIDRWLPDENRALFPELDSSARFPEPDIIAHFDIDRLQPLPDASTDFVICSHVLEHLADPIGFLDDIYRVLRPGGATLLLLPDRRRTFDRCREPTSLEHLISEFRSGVKEVDDVHILDFIAGVHRAMGSSSSIPAAETEPAYLALQRQRSVHAHCWANDEFVPVILYGIEKLGHNWDFVDGLLTEEQGGDNFEFGFVLRRLTVDLDSEIASQRFSMIWNAWRQVRYAELSVRAGQKEPLIAHQPSLISQCTAFARRVHSRWRRLRENRPQPDR